MESNLSSLWFLQPCRIAIGKVMQAILVLVVLTDPHMQRMIIA